MAATMKTSLILVLLVAALWVQADASATIINISTFPVDVFVNGDTVHVLNNIVHVDVHGKSTHVQVKDGSAKPLDVDVVDNDVVVIVPNLLAAAIWYHCRLTASSSLEVVSCDDGACASPVTVSPA